MAGIEPIVRNSPIVLPPKPINFLNEYIAGSPDIDYSTCTIGNNLLNLGTIPRYFSWLQNIPIIEHGYLASIVLQDVDTGGGGYIFYDALLLDDAYYMTQQPIGAPEAHKLISSNGIFVLYINRAADDQYRIFHTILQHGYDNSIVFYPESDTFNYNFFYIFSGTQKIENITDFGNLNTYSNNRGDTILPPLTKDSDLEFWKYADTLSVEDCEDYVEPECDYCEEDLYNTPYTIADDCYDDCDSMEDECRQYLENDLYCDAGDWDYYDFDLHIAGLVHNYPFLWDAMDANTAYFCELFEFSYTWILDTEANRAYLNIPIVSSIPAPTPVPAEILKANFEMSISQGVSPLTVKFKNTSQGNPEYFYWLFDDGTTSTEENPTHTFTLSPNDSVKTYMVTLIVYKDGVSDQTSKIVMIYSADQLNAISPPIAKFTYSPQVTRIGDIVRFYRTPTSNFDSLLWDFGDGHTWHSDTLPTTHIYTKPGRYTVTLTLYIQGDPVSSYSAEVIAIGNDTNYSLAPLDISTSIKANLNIIPPILIPTQSSVKTYIGAIPKLGSDVNVYLPIWKSEVKTSIGANLYISKPVHITNPEIIAKSIINAEQHTFSLSDIDLSKYPPLVYKVEPSVWAGKKPLTVNFTFNAYNEVDAIEWDFGDGNTSNKFNPIHIYSTEGTYTVTVTAKNKNGSTTFKINIIVTGWMGLISGLEYYYVLNRSENFIYIYKKDSNTLFKRIGGKGSDKGKFINPTMLSVVLPRF